MPINIRARACEKEILEIIRNYFERNIIEFI